MNSQDISDEDLCHLACDEVARMLRRCREATPRIDGRRVMAHLVWVALKFHEHVGPQEAADSLERAAMHALFSLEGFDPSEIDEAMSPAIRVADAFKGTPSHERPMKRTRWPPDQTVVPFRRRPDQ